MTNLLSRVTTAIQDNMVERVTTVLHEKFGVQCGLNERAMWRPIARAAIEAMREPTEHMIGEGFRPAYTRSVEAPAVVWRAMIDSALSPLQPQSEEPNSSSVADSGVSPSGRTGTPSDLEVVAALNDLGARLGRGELIGGTPYAVACWKHLMDAAALITRLTET